MAAQATVSLVVDESGAVQGLTRFQARAMTAFGTTRDAAKQTAAAVDSVGVAGTKAGDAMAAGHDKANAHALTNLDTVRLLRDDLGVRIPRAMEKLIASTQAFQVIASAAFGIFAGIGGGELLYHVGKEVYDLGRKWLSVTAAAEDYADAQEENAKKDFVNVSSIEDAKLRIDDATKRVQAFREVANDLAKMSWSNILSNPATFLSQRLIANNFSKEAVVGQGQQDQLTPEMVKLQHEQTVQQIELNHAGDGYLKGKQKINAELAKELALDAAQLQMRQSLNSLDPNPHAKDSGESDRQLKDKIAEAKAHADQLNLEDETQREIRRMRAETAAIGLKGEQALMAQQAVELAALSTRDDAYAQRKGQIEAQTQAKIREMHAETAEKIATARAQAEEASLTGNARILADERRTIAEIEDQHKHSLVNGIEAAQLSANAHIKANGEIARSLQEYAKAERELRASLNVSGSQGYGRIAAESAKEVQDAGQRYHQVVDGMSADDKRRLDAYATYQSEMQDIQRKNDAASADLAQKNADETAKLADQAASVHTGGRGKGLMGLFGGDDSQTAKITAEYNQRERALQESYDKQELTLEEAKKRQVAIEQLYDAQMADEQRSMRDKLSGMIESGFKDPFSMIRNAMKQEMAGIIADWIMQMGVFKHAFGDSMTGGQGAQKGMLQRLVEHTGGQQGTQAPSFKPEDSGYSSGTAGRSQTLSDASTLGGLGGGSTPYYSSGGIYDDTAQPNVSGSDSSGAPGGVMSMSMAGGSAIAQAALNIARAGGRSPSSSSAVPAGVSGDYQDNGEEGGFAGYMTGDNSDTDLANSVNDDPNNVNANAAQQAQSLDRAAPSNNLTIGGVVGAGFGAYAGAKGVVSSFESGKASGILTGAESGATMGGSVGMLLGGPFGAAIGAGIGAVGGATAGLVGWATGEGGRLAAAKYFKANMRMQMEHQAEAYESGAGGDIFTALSQVNDTAMQGYLAMGKQFGGDAASWAKSHYIDPEIRDITAKMNRLAAQGHDATTHVAAAQFHQGGTITGFGDWATSSTEGMIHALLGETVMKPAATMAHGPVLGAMNSGASPSDIASMYLQSSGTSGGSTNHYHTHHYDIDSLDAKSFRDFLVHGGGSDAVAEAANKRATRYSGDSF